MLRWFGRFAIRKGRSYLGQKPLPSGNGGAPLPPLPPKPKSPFQIKLEAAFKARTKVANPKKDVGNSKPQKSGFMFKVKSPKKAQSHKERLSRWKAQRSAAKADQSQP